MINLQKGHRINLEKNDGSKLTQFCVGCNWGAITKPGFLGLGTKVVDVDVDLSCVMVDEAGHLVDTLYSPLYNPKMFTSRGLPVGKDWSADNAMYHTPDDTSGDTNGDDGLDNEIITVNLNKVDPRIQEIYFFLNIFDPKDINWGQIPYVAIRMFEGTPDKVKEVFAQYDVAKEPALNTANSLVMGRLYRRDGGWKFEAIGKAFDDSYDLRNTIARIVK